MQPFPMDQNENRELRWFNRSKSLRHPQGKIELFQRKLTMAENIDSENNPQSLKNHNQEEINLTLSPEKLPQMNNLMKENDQTNALGPLPELNYQNLRRPQRLGYMTSQVPKRNLKIHEGLGKPQNSDKLFPNRNPHPNFGRPWPSTPSRGTLEIVEYYNSFNYLQQLGNSTFMEQSRKESESSKSKSFLNPINLKEVFQSPKSKSPTNSNTIAKPTENVSINDTENNITSEPSNHETTLNLINEIKKDEDLENSEKEEDEIENIKYRNFTNRKIPKRTVSSLIRKKEDKLKLRETSQFNKFLILPDDSFKTYWSMIMTLLLTFTALVTPYRISFVEYDTTDWAIIDYSVDLLFSIDIFLNFFSAYYDSEYNLITDRKIISINYLKSWFLIDMIAVIPISLILKTTDYASLARIARIPRIYRLLKITKLARMLKVVKERNKLISYLNELFKLKVGLERLTYFSFLFFILCHLSGCLWYLSVKFDENNPETWVNRNNLQDCSNFSLYISSFYWAITTITTVGYGDISAFTNTERILAIIVMVIGVCSYSFAIGTLTSVLSTLDSKEAKLKEKLNILEDLNSEYKLNYETYIKLKKVLKYDHSRNAADKFEFLKSLPPSLKVELSVRMHQDTINKIGFFQNRNQHFISFIGPMLRPIKIMTDEYIFEKNDPIDEIFFLVRGEVSFVLKQYQDLPYLQIDEGEYFGDLDFYFHSKTDHGKRMFTAKALKDCELLVLNKNDLLSVDDEFPEIINELFQNTEKKVDKILEIEAQFEKEAKKYLGRSDTMELVTPVKFSSMMDLNILASPLKNIDEEKNEQEEDKDEIEETKEIIPDKCEEEVKRLLIEEGEISNKSSSLESTKNGFDKENLSDKIKSEFLSKSNKISPKKRDEFNRNTPRTPYSQKSSSKRGGSSSPRKRKKSRLNITTTAKNDFKNGMDLFNKFKKKTERRGTIAPLKAIKDKIITQCKEIKKSQSAILDEEETPSDDSIKSEEISSPEDKSSPENKPHLSPEIKSLRSFEKNNCTNESLNTDQNLLENNLKLNKQEIDLLNRTDKIANPQKRLSTATKVFANLRTEELKSFDSLSHISKEDDNFSSRISETNFMKDVQNQNIRQFSLFTPNQFHNFSSSDEEKNNDS